MEEDEDELLLLSFMARDAMVRFAIRSLLLLLLELELAFVVVVPRTCCANPWDDDDNREEDVLLLLFNSMSVFLFFWSANLWILSEEKKGKSQYHSSLMTGRCHCNGSELELNRFKCK